jgi:hypothetical protein
MWHLFSVIWRWYLRDDLSILEIAKRSGLSPITVRKFLRPDTIKPQFKVRTTSDWAPVRRASS